MAYLVSKLNMTNGERLELDRRRLDWTQAQMAKFFGVATSRYRRWESDKEETDVAPALGIMLHAGEWCFLMRRRAGLTLKQLQAKTSLTTRWLRKTERCHTTGRGARTLVACWRKIQAVEQKRNSTGLRRQTKP